MNTGDVRVGNDALRALAYAIGQSRPRVVRALHTTAKLVMRQMVDNALHGHGEGARYWKAYSKGYAKRKKGGRRVPATLKDTGELHKRWKVRTPKGTRTFTQGRNRPTFDAAAARFRDTGSGRFVGTLEALRTEKHIVNDTPYLKYHVSDKPRRKIPLRRPGMGTDEGTAFAREGARRLVRAILPGRLRAITADFVVKM